MDFINSFESNGCFIVVDDDIVSNLICQKIINHVFPKTDVQTFINPEKVLIYIKSIYANSNGKATILLLDINMPILSGWDFLEEFEYFNSHIKGQIKIYMLSSSREPQDKDRASKNKNVYGFIEKPLSKEIIAEMTILKIKL
jgi:CheY-like chemotaxis protein